MGVKVDGYLQSVLSVKDCYPREKSLEYAIPYMKEQTVDADSAANVRAANRPEQVKEGWHSSSDESLQPLARKQPACRLCRYGEGRQIGMCPLRCGGSNADFLGVEILIHPTGSAVASPYFISNTFCTVEKSVLLQISVDINLYACLFHTF